MAEPKECQCEWCTTFSPGYQRLKARTHPDDLPFLDEMLNRMMCAEDDLNYAEAKLDGSWPGWEWIVEAKKVHDAHHTGAAEAWGETLSSVSLTTGKHA